MVSKWAATGVIFHTPVAPFEVSNKTALSVILGKGKQKNLRGADKNGVDYIILISLLQAVNRLTG